MIVIQPGAKTATARTTEARQRALEEVEPSPLDPARRESLDDYPARRQQKIDNGGP